MAVRTLNEEDNIKNCLQSLLNQTLLPTKILIIDNNSTDGTIHIANGFSSELPISIIENPIKGFASGLNVAAHATKTKYLAFLSADCSIDQNWLLNLYSVTKDKQASVVQGTELLNPRNDVHSVLQHKLPPQHGSRKLRYFNNTNTLYHLPTLKKFLPFVSNIGGEDTLMSIRYRKAGLKAYQSYDAIAKHNKYANFDEFKQHCRRHAKVCVKLMKNEPLLPRIYLHAYYWGLRDMLRFIRYRDRRFLKLGYCRLTATLQGMFIP